MYLWRRNYPRVRYQPVVSIHGIFYTVKNEIVFKHRYAEWVLPGSMQKHIPYNPRQLPVVISSQQAGVTPTSLAQDTQPKEDRWQSSVPSASASVLLSSLQLWGCGS